MPYVRMEDLSSGLVMVALMCTLAGEWHLRYVLYCKMAM